MEGGRKMDRLKKTAPKRPRAGKRRVVRQSEGTKKSDTVRVKVPLARAVEEMPKKMTQNNPEAVSLELPGTYSDGLSRIVFVVVCRGYYWTGVLARRYENTTCRTYTRETWKKSARA